MGRLVALAALALPFVEIAGFVVIGGRIGVLATLAWVVLAAMLGIALIRRQGLEALRRARAALGRGESPTAELAEGALVALAGVLLLIPGFVTDAVGLPLAVPAVRRLIVSRMRTRLARRGQSRPGLMELEVHEYREGGERKPDSHWRQP